MLHRVAVGVFFALVGLVMVVGAPALAQEAAPAPAKLDAKKLVAPKATPELLAKGAAAYTLYCVACHGEKGVGDGPAGLALTPRPRDFSKDPFKQGTKPAEVFVTISEGVKDTPMVGWAHLSEEDRWGLSYHVLTMVPAKKAKKTEKTAPR